MNKKMVKDIAEIKLIPFTELKSSDVLLLKGLFEDLRNGIRSERDYFKRANQNASILDTYFEGESTEDATRALPMLGINLTKKTRLEKRRLIKKLLHKTMLGKWRRKE